MENIPLVDEVLYDDDEIKAMIEETLEEFIKEEQLNNSIIPDFRLKVETKMGFIKEAVQLNQQINCVEDFIYVLLKEIYVKFLDKLWNTCVLFV